MKFKEGNRVHVTRLDRIEVDFYGTLVDLGGCIWELVDCSNSEYEKEEVLKDDNVGFGVNLDDYYTLVTDEEDTEPPEVQYVKREKKIELDDHYIIEVKKGLYVQNVTSDYFFRFTKYINKADVYEYKNAALKHAEFVNGNVLNLKRYIEE